MTRKRANTADIVQDAANNAWMPQMLLSTQAGKPGMLGRMGTRFGGPAGMIASFAAPFVAKQFTAGKTTPELEQAAQQQAANPTTAPGFSRGMGAGPHGGGQMWDPEKQTAPKMAGLSAHSLRDARLSAYELGVLVMAKDAGLDAQDTYAVRHLLGLTKEGETAPPGDPTHPAQAAGTGGTMSAPVFNPASGGMEYAPQAGLASDTKQSAPQTAASNAELTRQGRMSGNISTDPHRNFDARSAVNNDTSGWDKLNIMRGLGKDLGQHAYQNNKSVRLIADENGGGRINDTTDKALHIGGNVAGGIGLVAGAAAGGLGLLGGAAGAGGRAIAGAGGRAAAGAGGWGSSLANAANWGLTAHGMLGGGGGGGAAGATGGAAAAASPRPAGPMGQAGHDMFRNRFHEAKMGSDKAALGLPKFMGGRGLLGGGKPPLPQTGPAAMANSRMQGARMSLPQQGARIAQTRLNSRALHMGDTPQLHNPPTSVGHDLPSHLEGLQSAKPPQGQASQGQGASPATYAPQAPVGGQVGAPTPEAQVVMARPMEQGGGGGMLGKVLGGAAMFGGGMALGSPEIRQNMGNAWKAIRGEPINKFDPSKPLDPAERAKAESSLQQGAVNNLNNLGFNQQSADYDTMQNYAKSISQGLDPHTAWAYATSGQTSDSSRNRLAARLAPQMESMTGRLNDPRSVEAMRSGHAELQRRAGLNAPANGMEPVPQALPGAPPRPVLQPAGQAQVLPNPMQ